MSNAVAKDPVLTRSEVASWLLAAALLVVAVKFRLLATLFAGFLVFELVHILVPVFHLSRLAGKRAKLVAVALLSAAIVGLLTVVIFWAAAFIRGGAENLPLLIRTMAEILEESRHWLPPMIEEYLPADVEAMKLDVAEWLRGHAGDLKVVGRETLRTVAHLLIGMVVGAMLSLREALPGQAGGAPLATALGERVRRFGGAFRRIVFAQVRISGLNAFLTWLYLGVGLPLFGISLPYTKTLIAVTFLAGLLPVVGNLISNTVIVVVSLSHSLGVAAASLAFLVVIHKLEYFLNAHIIGSRIRASAWELLLAMLLMEAAFGLRGLIAAPVYYAYLKDELSSRGLV
jgi:predicted PurR-regulated permease PerM